MSDCSIGYGGVYARCRQLVPSVVEDVKGRISDLRLHDRVSLQPAARLSLLVSVVRRWVPPRMAQRRPDQSVVVCLPMRTLGTKAA